MGEFDEETVSEPVADASEVFGMAAGEPPALEPTDPTIAFPQVASAADEPSAAADEMAAVHQQLLLDVPEVEVAPAPTPVAAEEPEPAVDPNAIVGDFDAIPVSAAVVAAEGAASPEAAAEAATDGATDEAATVADVPATEDAASADDIAAALAAASEQIGVEPTLDDIAPGTKQYDYEDDAAFEAVEKFGAPWWPFLIYAVLWIAAVGLGVWQLKLLPATTVTFESQTYSMYLFGGLVMAALGPILVLGVWLASRFASSRRKEGLFSSALFKGSLITVIGVVLWWGGLLAVDYLRLGRF